MRWSIILVVGIWSGKRLLRWDLWEARCVVVVMRVERVTSKLEVNQTKFEIADV
jgi:hypothetical protein